MLVKTYTLFSLILLFSFKCLSQTNYQPGFYITLDNDSIHGLINDRSGVGNYIHCIFKPYKSSKSQKLSPEEIQSYQFQDGRYFLSKNIYVDSVKRQVFVEFLVDGISDLFLYRDKEHYFYVIENANGETIELQKEEITDWSDPTQHDPYFHIRKLKVAFADCMEIQPQVEQADFSNKSLIKLTRDYHNYVCDEYECIVYEKKVNYPRILIAPIVGISSSNIWFGRGFFSELDYTRNTFETFGLRLNFNLVNINKDISIQLDGLYGRNNYYGIYRDHYQLYINNNRFQYSLLVKYRFNNPVIRPSFGFGAVGEQITYFQPIAIVDNIPGSPPVQREINDIRKPRTLFGGVVELGLHYIIFKNREFFTNIRYTQAKAQSEADIGYINTKTNSIQIIVGCFLSKLD